MNPQTEKPPWWDLSIETMSNIIMGVAFVGLIFWCILAAMLIMKTVR